MKSIKITNSIENYIEFEQDEVSNLEGWEYPSVISVIQDIAGDRVPIYISSKRGRRRLSFLGLKKPMTLGARADLIGVLSQDGEMKLLEFTTLDDIDLRCDVEILNLIFPYKGYSSPLLIEMVAPDPRFYGQTLNSIETGITSPGGGMAIPAAIPASFDYGGTERPVIVVGGNTKAPPTFIIHGPGSGFVVQNVTTGKLFNLDLTLTSAEQVTVDVASRTVVKGTNTNVFGSFNGDFFHLQVGNNEMHFNATSGIGGNTKLTVQYRNTYEGI